MTPKELRGLAEEYHRHDYRTIERHFIAAADTIEDQTAELERLKHLASRAQELQFQWAHEINSNAVLRAQLSELQRLLRGARSLIAAELPGWEDHVADIDAALQETNHDD